MPEFEVDVSTTRRTARAASILPTIERKAENDLLWFVIWLIANNVGAREPLVLDPVNAWIGTLILAIALDLAAANTDRGWSRPGVKGGVWHPQLYH